MGALYLDYKNIQSNTAVASQALRLWLQIFTLFYVSLNFSSNLYSDFLREVKEWLRKDAVKVELESLHSLGPNILSTFLAENILQANYI